MSILQAIAIFFNNLSYVPINSFIFLLLLPYACSINFQIHHFESSVDNIVYQGDAVALVGAVKLINRRTYLCRVGWATYAKRVPIWDSDTGRLTNFSTHFSFIIDTTGENPFDHGIAFFLAHDPDYEHVGINNSIYYVVTTPWNASIHSGDITDVWIAYNATTKNLSVHWRYQATSNHNESTSLFHQIDLKEILPEWVTIGFSIGIGKYGERDMILSKEFNSTLERKESSGNNAKKKTLVVGLTVSRGVLIAGVFIALIVRRWKWKQK
ncbi:unnamed protein product [Prunus armeniaca]